MHWNGVLLRVVIGCCSVGFMAAALAVGSLIALTEIGVEVEFVVNRWVQVLGQRRCLRSTTIGRTTLGMLRLTNLIGPVV